MGEPEIIDEPAVVEPPVVDEPKAEPKADEPKAKATPKDEPVDDWRSRIAGDDPDALKWLGRFHNEAAYVKATKELHDGQRAGKFIKPLDENATDEDVAAYRKMLGVPEKPEGYLETLPDGLVVGEDDKPFVDKFVEAMHAVNAPKADVAAALSTYYNIVEEQAAAKAEEADQFRGVGEEVLRQEWGADYRRNLNAMHGHLETLPESVRAVFMHGEMPEFDDGGEPTGRTIPIGYHPDVLKWLTAVALDKNPLATVVPGAGANQASAVADEIKQIEEVMRTNRKKYNDDPAMQERLRTLYEARGKLR